jgi:hypothetical protein
LLKFADVFLLREITYSLSNYRFGGVVSVRSGDLGGVGPDAARAVTTRSAGMTALTRQDARASTETAELAELFGGHEPLIGRPGRGRRRACRPAALADPVRPAILARTCCAG